MAPKCVKRILSRINPHKAAEQDNSPGFVLKEFVEELKDVLADIFSLSQAAVPMCLKATLITPIPKKPFLSIYNDFWSVALISIDMKCFERLVMPNIKSILPPSLNPSKFVYRPNRSSEDAISAALHPALMHLDSKNTHVQMLLLDFSLAFNQYIHLPAADPQTETLCLQTSLCNWVLDFLSESPLSLQVNCNTSKISVLNTSPKGVCAQPVPLHLPGL